MRLALAQINTVVGDLDGNRDRIVGRLEEARDAGRRPRPLPRARRHRLPARGPAAAPRVRPRRRARPCERIAPSAPDVVALVGAPHYDRDLSNACFVLADGGVRAVYRKRFLPNYGVFDEDRYFAPGHDLFLLRLGETLVGTTDLRGRVAAGAAGDRPRARRRRAAHEHLRVAVPRRQGARARGDARHAGARQRLLPRVLQRGRRPGRAPLRRALVRDRRRGRRARAGAGVRGGAARGRRRPVRGDRPAADRRPPARARARARRRARGAGGRPRAPCAPARTARARPRRSPSRSTSSSRCGAALELALRDYVEKNGFARGGARRLRRDRLGADGGARRPGARRRPRPLRVDAVALLVRGRRSRTRGGSPSRSGRRSSSSRSGPSYEALDGDARRAPSPAASPTSTEENLQARIRGVLLMALSNKFGWLVVTTGNKSELSVGYSTLYGDMAGGFALLKDVYKTDVFRLARHLNERAGRELIPVSIIERAPSAELRDDQRDEDSLPPYAVLDARAEALRRGGPLARGAPRRRLRPGGGRADARARRPGRVQAAAGAARAEAPPEGLRPRPANADHEPLAGTRRRGADRAAPEDGTRRCPTRQAASTSASVAKRPASSSSAMPCMNAHAARARRALPSTRRSGGAAASSNRSDAAGDDAASRYRFGRASAKRR